MTLVIYTFFQLVWENIIPLKKPLSKQYPHRNETSSDVNEFEHESRPNSFGNQSSEQKHEHEDLNEFTSNSRSGSQGEFMIRLKGLVERKMNGEEVLLLGETTNLLYLQW